MLIATSRGTPRGSRGWESRVESTSSRLVPAHQTPWSRVEGLEEASELVYHRAFLVPAHPAPLKLIHYRIVPHRFPTRAPSRSHPASQGLHSASAQTCLPMVSHRGATASSIAEVVLPPSRAATTRSTHPVMLSRRRSTATRGHYASWLSDARLRPGGATASDKRDLLLCLPCRLVRLRPLIRLLPLVRLPPRKYSYYCR